MGPTARFFLMRKVSKWSDEDTAILREYYPKPEVFVRLAHRSEASIRAKAYYLGLYVISNEWSASAIRRFRTDARSLSNSELSLRYGRTLYAVKQQKVVLGLRQDRRPLEKSGISELAVSVRDRASVCDISLNRLVSECGFSHGALSLVQLRAAPCSEVLARASTLLGGELYAVWED
ncbi:MULTISPECIES: hypothetical protein [unclassified Devosia]|uniref:hypothetical protein n=1 Tax=unclassified Devosia TaxID=196773 RepID=UPI00086C2B38|nr:MULTISPECIES: hypothetical protein [unclassified Devosia]MBN9361901.1 hypothetical protein [Devosia sp.]ODS94878.1 MAG: hypothetical protein ABS47_04765 [Devosia sp. SCN 66-27]OJX20598.1 MAG: hypothetical protein BGO83_13405 [Devosia sp. 66-14]